MSSPSESDIYNRLAVILKEIAPCNSIQAICTAEISSDNDHAKMYFDYIDKTGVKSWFIPTTPAVDSELFDLFVELRKIFIQKDYCTAENSWSTCTVELNIASSKIELSVKY